MWGLNTENCDTSEVFANITYPEILEETTWEFAWDRGRKVINARPTQNSHTFSVWFSGFKNFTSATVFGIKSLSFRYQLIFTCSFQFMHLREKDPLGTAGTWIAVKWQSIAWCPQTMQHNFMESVWLSILFSFKIYFQY